MTKVLVLGKDGRTHCIADAISAGGGTVYGMSDFDTPGLKRLSKQFRRARTDDVRAVLEFAKEVRPDLAVIGPEEPLAAGVVDAIQEELGTPCVGPTKALARIESSKSFTRKLLVEYAIPGNIEHRVFDSLDGLEKYLRRLQQFVIKPDGLTGGKGVKVFGEQLDSIEHAVAYASELLAKRKGPVVVEEKLEGEEFSLQSLCDGESVIHTIPVQDHKRALEGDRGPNTGGMGSYSCEDHALPFLSREHLVEAREINARVMRALQAKTGQPYRGVLYGGFMVTAEGVRLLEYNARFGDPEAMNVLSVLNGNFLEVCEAIASGSLNRVSVEFEPKATVCKYVVPQGYPDNPVQGVAIDADSIPKSTDEVRVYYAAVNESEGKIFLTGSRAIALVGVASSVFLASELVERAISKIPGPLSHRRDIGTRELIQKRVSHYEHLRDPVSAYA
jgi:phosphoribosylamine--glycine ligase